MSESDTPSAAQRSSEERTGMRVDLEGEGFRASALGVDEIQSCAPHIPMMVAFGFSAMP